MKWGNVVFVVLLLENSLLLNVGMLVCLDMGYVMSLNWLWGMLKAFF